MISYPHLPTPTAFGLEFERLVGKGNPPVKVNSVTSVPVELSVTPRATVVGDELRLVAIAEARALDGFRRGRLTLATAHAILYGDALADEDPGELAARLARRAKLELFEKVRLVAQAQQALDHLLPEWEFPAKRWGAPRPVEVHKRELDIVDWFSVDGVGSAARIDVPLVAGLVQASPVAVAWEQAHRHEIGERWLFRPHAPTTREVLVATDCHHQVRHAAVVSVDDEEV